jgi:hypothetical protein
VRSTLLFFCLFAAKLSFSQVFIESAPVGAAATGEFNFYGTNTLSGKVPYNRIKGSPFWRDEWQLATLYSGNRRFKILPVRLNLATQEIYYLLNEEEFVATPENGITAVVFHEGKDTATKAAIFLKSVPHAFLRSEPVSGFMQVLNTGRHQLLKYTNRVVNAADSLFGTQKRYFFRDNVYYFVQSSEMVKLVKKLNEESFLSLLPASSACRGWIKEQRLSFKKEEDLVKFMVYYSSRIDDKAE